MLINIIHPHTYKGRGDSLIIGGCPENEVRDQKVADYVTKALDTNVAVLLHSEFTGSFLESIMRASIISMDPIFKIMEDDRIEEIYTRSNGKPLPKEKPSEISQDLWDYLAKYCINHSDLKSKTTASSSFVFIGGMTEACVVNAAIYFHDHYRTNGQELFYVPELCVPFPKELLTENKIHYPEKIIENLNKKVKPITYQEALHLLPL